MKTIKDAYNELLALKPFIAVPHQRFGNERAWSVTGGTLKQGQIVHLHAMCNAQTAINKAIKQDSQE